MYEGIVVNLLLTPLSSPPKPHKKIIGSLPSSLTKTNKVILITSPPLHPLPFHPIEPIRP